MEFRNKRLIFSLKKFVSDWFEADQVIECYKIEW